MWKKRWGGHDQEWSYQRDSCAECFRDDAEVGTGGWEEKEENSEWSKRGCQPVWEEKMQRIREDGCSWLAVAKPVGNPWKKFFYAVLINYFRKHTQKNQADRQCKQNMFRLWHRTGAGQCENGWRLSWRLADRQRELADAEQWPQLHLGEFTGHRRWSQTLKSGKSKYRLIKKKKRKIIWLVHRRSLRFHCLSNSSTPSSPWCCPVSWSSWQTSSASPCRWEAASATPSRSRWCSASPCSSSSSTTCCPETASATPSSVSQPQTQLVATCALWAKCNLVSVPQEPTSASVWSSWWRACCCPW